MFRINGFFGVIMALVVNIIILFPPEGEAASYKVLVVMSYESDFPWVLETKEGINATLADTCEVKYVYLNTKADFEGGRKKAKEAHALYLDFRPDGVIAADDNAQFMFVVPYLKDKVKTPVMFCGVNAEPEKYGYPAVNVSGILERLHIGESIAFVQQLLPSIKTFGVIMRDSPSSKGVLRQIEKQSGTYPAEFIAFKQPRTLADATAMAEDLKKRCDILFMASMEGVTDINGRPLEDRVVMPIVAKTFAKPTIASNSYNVKFAALCAVVKTGQEQGSTAARMLLKAMQGTPVSQIPITRNRNGKRMINVSVMKELGVKPKPIILRGAELVRTEN